MLMSQAKAQMAIEFVIMVAVAVIVGTLFLGISNEALRGSVERERLAAINDVGFTIQDELILASQVQNGYSRTFTIPEKAGRFTYDIAHSELGVQINSGAIVITYAVPNATGTLSKGQNTITKDGGVTIS